MEYSVLSPRGEVDPVNTIGLNPRVSDLNGKTIGLFASFKQHWVIILDEIGKQLQARYPSIKLTRFQNTKDLNSDTQVAEVAKDPEVRPVFEKWLSGVDTVIVANADAGSCTLYLTFNTTLVERLGKPVVMMLDKEFTECARSAAALRGVPALRTVELAIPDISVIPDITEWIEKIIPERVSAVLDKIIAALTRPLTPEEKNPPKPPPDLPRIVHKGTIDQINEFYYKRGWAYGMPVMPPTEEAVKEMLKGTDLPRDYVVAKIPPMMGKATVEKIAINAVMAGCLPTYLPVLIAAVQALVDPRMWIEAYTCSVASWAPMVIINGPIRHDIDARSGVTLLTPYYKSTATIGHAIALMLINIAGVRPGIEDMAILGHEGRFGICFAENEEDSPWEPLHEFYGLNKKDSAVTIFWPNMRQFAFGGKEVGGILKDICDSAFAMGFDPGMAVIMFPATARLLAANGFSRRAVTDYIVEFARRPATEVNVRWMKGNHHLLKGVLVPEDPTRSAKKFFRDLHLPIVVAGLDYAWGTALYTGGGDHGGPITKKIELPKNWNELVAKYKDIRPNYK